MGTEREQPPDQDIEAAWSEEIEERLTEIDAGIVGLIPWEEVREELFTPPVTPKSNAPLNSIRILHPATPHE